MRDTSADKGRAVGSQYGSGWEIDEVLQPRIEAVQWRDV